ncbi:MAG: hypothetical protein KKH29_03940 [Candidatus Omnitrophica bacterium]|nr:hypothetical protein [Candidatus Omnitrophota bacterium]MBU4472649.1 hypothetical protein [Candidatus Omnitrophota bacterium]MCG2706728.1 hypothetical protein [Candidatus Omnitrophota bacterium]
MRRTIIFSGIILFFSAGLCFAQEESITITTYYPSPYGSYNELTTTGDTYLAIDSGSQVGIGTTDTNSYKLHVKANATSPGQIGIMVEQPEGNQVGIVTANSTIGAYMGVSNFYGAAHIGTYTNHPLILMTGAIHERSL